MSFILRAALVIGTLSYFALQRDGSVPSLRELSTTADRHRAEIAVLANAVPTEMRAAAAQAVTVEVLRKLSADMPSRDTLLAVDRRPDWRGSDAR